MSTIGEALARAIAAGVPRLDAQLLLAQLLGRPRSWLLAHDDEPLPPASDQAFRAGCARLLDGEPLAYLTGEREFHGLSLRVSPAVLVPRPDTETLVDWALALLATELAHAPAPAVIDLGTGSGAVALALRHRCPRAQVTATDASPEALAVAADNARRLGLPLQLAQGDWWQAVPPQPRWHLALSNPPYIAAGDPHLPALRHEPAMALTPGGDGLGAIECLIAGAVSRLQPGGWLLLEHGHDQAEPVRRRLAAAGFDAVQSRRDLAGHERCSGGRSPH